MPFANSSSLILRIIKEAQFGVIPNAGNPRVMRIKGETLKFNITKEESKEINPSRTINSVIPVTANANGGIDTEIYAGPDMDAMLEGVMFSTFTPFGVNGMGVATPASVSATAITATAATSGSSVFTNLRPGQVARIKSAGPNNGKVVRVHASTAPTPTVLTVDPATPLVVSANESIQVFAMRLTHGSDQSSYTIERENPDIDVFIAYTGMVFSKLGMTVASGALSEMKFEFMGKGGFAANDTQLPGIPVAPSTSDIHSGVTGATTAVWVNGAPLAGTYCKSVTLDFDNTLRSQEAIGELGAIGIGNGTIKASMKATVYFANKDLFDQFKSNTNSMFSFASTDMAGNGYIFTAPRANVADWVSNGTAKDQDQMVEVTMTLLSDDSNANPALRKLLFIDRIGAA